MIIGDSRNEDWPINSELCLPTRLSFRNKKRCVKATALLHRLTRFSGQPLAPLFPHSWKRPWRYFNSFTWGKDSFPTQSRQFAGYLLSSKTSDLKVLILIPAALHAAANRSKVTDHWCHQAHIVWTMLGYWYAWLAKYVCHVCQVSILDCHFHALLPFPKKPRCVNVSVELIKLKLNFFG